MVNQLRVPTEGDGADPTWDRLEDQLDWYGRKSAAAQQTYKRTKLAQLVVGVAVPVTLLFRSLSLSPLLPSPPPPPWPRARPAALPNIADDRRQVLAERLEGLVSREHARWISGCQRDVQQPATDVRAN